MSVSEPWEKIEWGADSKPQKSERVPSSANSALVYEPKCGGRGAIAGSQTMRTAVHMEPK
jgi:hypothetical protein